MWNKGQQYRGQLLEDYGDGERWLVSIVGKLIVVKNNTALSFRKHQWVLLEVRTIRPLSFHVIGRAQRTDRHLSVRI